MRTGCALAALAAVALIAGVCRAEGVRRTGPSMNARDALLAEPRPWPANRTDSVSRAENGREWAVGSNVWSRTPLLPYDSGGEPGPASYGAPVAQMDRVIYVRSRELVVAINPWERLDGYGDLRRFETARNRWLAEQGYVLRVRTFRGAPAGEARTEVRPRATIELLDEPARRPARQRVDADAPHRTGATAPITRVSLPPGMPAPTLVRVEEAPTDLAGARADAN